MWRWVAVVAAVAAFVGPVGCSKSAAAKAPPTTVLPEALWVGQSKVWLNAHSSSLSDISAAAKNVGDAAKAGSNNLTQIAAADMLVKVGLADGTLPDNAFGRDMHRIFVDYANALETIRKGILKNDQATFKSGADALAHAVADFGSIVLRMNATP